MQCCIKPEQQVWRHLDTKPATLNNISNLRSLNGESALRSVHSPSVNIQASATVDWQPVPRQHWSHYSGVTWAVGALVRRGHVFKRILVGLESFSVRSVAGLRRDLPSTLRWSLLPKERCPPSTSSWFSPWPPLRPTTGVPARPPRSSPASTSKR